MNQFIKLHTANRDWQSHIMYTELGEDVIIRLDTVLRINPLREICALPNKSYSSTEWDPVAKRNVNVCSKAHYATIVAGGSIGLGINGVETTIEIDEPSYYKLLKALDIENLE